MDYKFTAACLMPRYKGYVALTRNDNSAVYIGNAENYDDKGNYDNADNSLFHISDNRHAFNFLITTGYVLNMDQAVTRLGFTKKDFRELARIEKTLLNAGMKRNAPFMFDTQPFLPDSETDDTR